MARQGQRSGATAVQPQRQHSNNFLESSSNGRWLQSAGLQHLQSSNDCIPALQVVYQLGLLPPLVYFLLYGVDTAQLLVRLRALI